MEKKEQDSPVDASVFPFQSFMDTRVLFAYMPMVKNFRFLSWPEDVAIPNNISGADLPFLGRLSISLFLSPGNDFIACTQGQNNLGDFFPLKTLKN